MPSFTPILRLDELHVTEARDGYVRDLKYDFPDNPLLPIIEAMADLLDAKDADLSQAEEAMQDYENRIDNARCYADFARGFADQLGREEFPSKADADLMSNLADELEKL